MGLVTAPEVPPPAQGAKAILAAPDESPALSAPLLELGVG